MNEDIQKKIDEISVLTGNKYVYGQLKVFDEATGRYVVIWESQ